MNKQLASTICKPTRLRANKLLVQVQKGQKEGNLNISTPILITANWTSRSIGQEYPCTDSSETQTIYRTAVTQIRG